MKKTSYYLAYDDGNMIIKNTYDSLLKKFDKKTKTWVEDVELSRIFFGSIPVRNLSVKQVKKMTGGIL